MTKAQFRFLMLLTVISGLVGGGLSDLLFRSLPARAAQTTVAPKVIEAQEFRLVDGEGKERAALQFSEGLGEPELSLYDDSGKERASLSLLADGQPALGLLSPKEILPAMMLTVDGDEPMLWLRHTTGNAGISLSLNRGRPWLSIEDAAGKAGVALSLIDGEPYFSFDDRAGKARMTLFLANGAPAFSFSDEAGNTRSHLTLWADGEPSLTFFDAAGHGRLALGHRRLHSPSGATIRFPASAIALFGEDGQLLWQAP